MSREKFNPAADGSNDPEFQKFVGRLRSTPHQFIIVTGFQLKVREIDTLKRQKTDLEKKIQDFPDLPDTSDWVEKITELDEEIKKSAKRLVEARQTGTENFLASFPPVLNLSRSDFAPLEGYDQVAFTATLTLDKAMALQNICPPGKLGLRLDSYSPAAFSETPQQDCLSAARMFKRLVAYLQSLDLPRRHLGKAVDAADTYSGFLNTMSAAHDAKSFSESVLMAHRYRYRGPHDQHPLDLHFTRAILAARAAWTDDLEAKFLLKNLDFFLTQPGDLSTGMRGDCLEQDAIQYISDLYKSDPPALKKIKQFYMIDIVLTDEEYASTKKLPALKIENLEQKQKRMNELQTLASQHKNDPDFTKSMEMWQTEFEQLDAEAGRFAVQAIVSHARYDITARRFEQTKEIIVRCIEENRLAIDVAADIKHNESGLQFTLIATPAEMRVIQSLPEIAAARCDKIFDPWNFIQVTSGAMTDPGMRQKSLLPGTEYAP